jgi:titin
VWRDGSLLVSDLKTPTFVDTTVANDVTYVYQVQAVNPVGAAALSNPVSATPRPASPGAPSGVVAVAGDASAKVSWTVVPGATSYRVSVNGIVSATTSITRANLVGLTNDAVAAITVTAVNSGGVSAPSSTVSVTPLPTPPVTPTGLTAVATSTQVALTWAATPGATTYDVFVNGIAVGSTDATSWVAAGLTDGQPYTFAIDARNSGGTSSQTATVTATPAPAVPPTPASVVATAGDKQVTLTWAPSARATSYLVKQGSTVVATTQAATATLVGLTNGTTYTYTVTAVNVGGSSTASAPISVTPLSPVPPAPASLTAMPGNAQINLSWPAVAGATGYRVYRSGTFLAATTTNTYVATGLVNGTKYSYTVRSTNASGTSTTSSPSVTATPLAPPSTPTNVVLAPSDSALAVSWTASSTATSYAVYVGGIFAVSSSTTTAMITGLTNGTSYAVTVVALNAGGASAASSPVTGTPVPPAPATPTNVVAYGQDSRVLLTWTASTGADSYDIYRDGSLVGTSTATSWTDATVANGTTYSYAVSARNAGGGSLASSAVSATPQASSVTAPTVPTNVVATAGDSAATVSWSAVSTATSYQVLVNGAVAATTVTTSAALTGLVNGTTYSITVVASNAGGTSAPSTAVSVTPVPSAPSAPTNVVATAGNASVSLSWSAVTSATAYKVYQGSTLLTTTASTSYTATGLTNGTAYSFTVVATNAGGSSPASASASATPQPPAPTAPTNLAATPGNAQVVLSWTASAGATSYQVYSGSTLLGTTATTSYTATGLTNGATYSFTVVALNGGGASAASTAVTATPQPIAPSAPTNLVATPGDSQVVLSWSASSGATSYQIYSGGTLLTTTAATSYTVTGLTNGTAYSFTIIALNGGGASPASTAVSATPQAPAPVAPTNVVATAGNAQVVLSWSASTGATSYQVYAGSTLLGTSTTTTYTATGLTNGTAYSFTVVALNGGGKSPASTPVTATPQPPAPVAPTNVVATAGNAQVVLTWTASSGATSYQVYSGSTLLGTTTSTTYTATGLTNGTAYSFTVVAVNGGGASGASATVTATPKAPAPVAPTNLVATAGNAQVVLSWTASAGASSYQVYSGTTLLGTTTTTSYTAAGLTNGTTYSFTVVAVNSGGSSPASIAATATPQPPAPTVPTNVVATPGNAQVVLTWAASAGATSYQVYSGTTLLGTTTTTTYTATGLTNGTAYSFTVVAVNGGGSSPASPAVTATPLVASLAAPTNVVVDSSTSLLTGALRVTWTAVSGATSYSVYRDGTLLGTSTTTNYIPSSTPIGSQHVYTVIAVNSSMTSAASTAVTAGEFAGTVVNDALGRTVYGQIQVFLVVTQTTTNKITGCFATYPTTSDSGQINPTAIPQLCSQVISKQPTSANASTLITNASGASATSPAFKTSLQAALVSAGM